MSSRSAGRIPLLELKPEAAVPMYEQLYQGLRAAITGGLLPCGTRLAASRIIAGELGISRFTVVAALDRLLAEGYLEGRHGSGTYVCPLLPEHSMRASEKGLQANSTTKRSQARRPSLSVRGTALSNVVITGPRVPGGRSRPFHPRRPALDLFPAELWSKLLHQEWKRNNAEYLDYGEPAGYWPLRQAIADHVALTRAVRCSPEQVVVTSGAQQAFSILFELLLDPGDAAWIEEPGYLDVRAALIAAGANLIPVPVDRFGIAVDEGIRLAPKAKLAVVSPAHQYPMGATLSGSRRGALLEWARRSGAWIIEDDYDSFFRYSGRPLSALQALDVDTAGDGPSPRVLYVGTFSKTMFPSLRLGFCVVPQDMVEAVANARAVADRNSPIADQATLAAFLSAGHYERHLRRMRLHYRERYEAMLHAFDRCFGAELIITPAQAGVHVVAHFAEGIERRRRGKESLAVRVARAGESEDLVLFPLSRYFIGKPERDGLVLGYGNLSSSQIAAGAKRLARVARQCY